MSDIGERLATSRRVRFLVHGAERTGPPIFLLRILQEWAGSPCSIDAQVVLARGGPLQSAFESVAHTRTAGLHRRSPERLAQRVCNAARLRSTGTTVVDAATRWRAGRDVADLTVVNGATGPTADLLRALSPDGEVAMIAHELGTGWFDNLDGSQRSVLLARTDRYLAVSRCVASFLQEELGVPSDRIEVTWPPVPSSRRETSRPHPAARRGQSEIVVGGAGVHDWRKAPELWLQLAARVRDGLGPGRVRFIWFGGHGADEDPAWPIRHEMRALGLEGDVHFAGEVEDLLAEIEAVDIFVSTSREDAYPLVCAEACTAGVPVVTFRGGGAEELVLDSDGGRAVTYPDLEAMVRSVIELAENEPLRQQLGNNGRRFGRDKFDPAGVAAGVERWALEGNP